jgi:hypothetical protein
MPKTILQVNSDYHFDSTEHETVERSLQRAHALADLHGLIWKVWLRDEGSHRGGGILLFEDRESAERWVDAAFTRGDGQPWTSNVKWELFDIDDQLSAITHAKLGPAPGTASPSEVLGRESVIVGK